MKMSVFLVYSVFWLCLVYMILLQPNVTVSRPAGSRLERKSAGTGRAQQTADVRRRAVE
jgi:succinate-acetate transporter protein